MLNINLDTRADELRWLYLNKQLSTYRIAKRFNCNAETIRKKLKKLGIPLRTHRQARLAVMRNKNGNTIRREEEDFCKDCQNWILWTATSMGVKIHKCKLKRSPGVKEGKLFCPHRKEF